MAHDPIGSPIDRRDILCGGGAVLDVLVAIAGGRSARAAALDGPPTELDRVAVRVVIDSYQVAVAPGAKAGNVAIERFGWGCRTSRLATLISEFGLSLHVESQRGGETRQLLLTTASRLPTPSTIPPCRVDLAQLDALVLSHGHYDHFGGLAGFLRQTKSQLHPKLPFYIGGEECFCSREWTGPPAKGNSARSTARRWPRPT